MENTTPNFRTATDEEDLDAKTWEIIQKLLQILLDTVHTL